MTLRQVAVADSIDVDQVAASPRCLPLGAALDFSP